MRAALLTAIIGVSALWGLVSWLQPRMAFFPWQGVQQTPASVGLPYSDVKITTADGVALHGWWMEHPSPRGQVVYWHGNGGNLSLWLDVLADIRNRGFSVLAVDDRGYGASDGRPTEKGLYRDADAVNRYVADTLRRGGLRTIFWGRSLGCAVASYAASKSAPDALILESPFADIRSLFSGNPLMRALSIFSTYRFPTGRHLQDYRGPLLVVHGDADSIVPFAAGRKAYERAASAQKTLAVLKGADHNDVHARHPAYWTAVDAFLAGTR